MGNFNSGLRKPTSIKILEGGRGHRKLPLGEPKPRELVPECPADLTPEARAVWQGTVAFMRRTPGWLTEAEGDVLADYARSRARCLSLMAWLDKNGWTYEALFVHPDDKKAGQPEWLKTTWKPRPEVMIMERERRASERAAVRLGLDPSSRSRLNVHPRISDDDDGLDAIAP